ncbi:MAG TPA: hypothetical protein VG650_10965 [Mycobacteriales bacterium]|nr:hypothetical protein [Mycobacteriales bacterium]
MHHEDMHNNDIELGKMLPGVDLTLWVQLLVAAIVVVALGVWALTAM